MQFVFFGECMLEHRIDKLASSASESKSSSQAIREVIKQDGSQESLDAGFKFGGDTLNSALYLSRLLKKEHQVNYATGIGEDELSQQLLSCWQAEGIETELVSQIEHKTLGSYYIYTNELGERSFSYDRDNSAAKFYFGNRTEENCSNKLSD